MEMMNMKIEVLPKFVETCEEIDSLPKIIKSIQKQNHWSNREMARQMGISENWIRKCKKGEIKKSQALICGLWLLKAHQALATLN
jgi:ribosome-binding protein aMBF1 (putative translation factor)